jgi:hypothetical protein
MHTRKGLLNFLTFQQGRIQRLLVVVLQFWLPLGDRCLSSSFLFLGGFRGGFLRCAAGCGRFVGERRLFTEFFSSLNCELQLFVEVHSYH